jgi:hypothetical protein
VRRQPGTKGSRAGAPSPRSCRGSSAHSTAYPAPANRTCDQERGCEDENSPDGDRVDMAIRRSEAPERPDYSKRKRQHQDCGRCER